MPEAVSGYVTQLYGDGAKEINRAGVIPYTIKDDGIYLCLAKDKISGDYTDFGGGIRLGKENCIGGALREFKEESFRIFGLINPAKVNSCPAVVVDKTLVIFIAFEEIDITNVEEKFMSASRKATYSENSGLKWINLRDVGKYRIFHRIKPCIEHIRRYASIL